MNIGCDFNSILTFNLLIQGIVLNVINSSNLIIQIFHGRYFSCDFLLVLICIFQIKAAVVVEIADFITVIGNPIIFNSARNLVFGIFVNFILIQIFLFTFEITNMGGICIDVITPYLGVNLNCFSLRLVNFSVIKFRTVVISITDLIRKENIFTIFAYTCRGSKNVACILYIFIT